MHRLQPFMALPSAGFLLVFSALLFSVSPVASQYNVDNNCITNKESVMQRYERLYLTAYQEILKPDNTIEVASQMEEAGYLFKDLRQGEKNGIA